MPLIEDTMLENRYRIDNLLAVGGMSAVYRAFDTNLQIPVAIKENYFQTPQAVEQFKREALILARLRHLSLPNVLQHFSHEGQQYLVMEYIEGPNLWEEIKQRGKPFTEAQALTWINEVCLAVDYLHHQNPPIIHRDIKPQNIKLSPAGEVVLVDFGVAKEGSVEVQTATGAHGVTPGFSPPEQYSGSGSSPASDIYAMGATLYALITGVKPPDSVSLAIGEVEYVPPDKINPAVSLEITEAINWAMRPKPSERPQTVLEWSKELNSIVPLPFAEKSDPEIREKDADKVISPDAAKIVCPSCQSENRKGVKFCESCGTELASQSHEADKESISADDGMLICTNCGKKNESGLKFCEYCGKLLMGSSPKDESQAAFQKDDKLDCVNCGAKNRPGVRFCEDCGSSLDGG